MVEIFKTNVYDVLHAEQVIALLNHHFPTFMINFDLHDCDKILRIEAVHIQPSVVVSIVRKMGFECEVLE